MVTIDELCALPVTENVDIATERQYYAHWQKVMDPDWSAEQTAFAGGVFASRLSYLFIAGYQSAIRRTFGSPDNLWQALAISEDRSKDSPKPGVTLNHQQKINGFKTWVAASECTTHLLFNAASENGERLYRTTVETAGLSLQSKPKQQFLGDMSQGIAEFSDVSASDISLLLTAETPGDQAHWKAVMKQFSKREPLYLYFALCGRIHCLTDLDIKPVASQLLDIAAGDFTTAAHKSAFADVDSTISEMFADIQPRCFEGATASDQGVITLYSPVIQKRAGRG